MKSSVLCAGFGIGGKRQKETIPNKLLSRNFCCTVWARVKRALQESLKGCLQKTNLACCGTYKQTHEQCKRLNPFSFGMDIAAEQKPQLYWGPSLRVLKVLQTCWLLRIARHFGLLPALAFINQGTMRGAGWNCRLVNTLCCKRFNLGAIQVVGHTPWLCVCLGRVPELRKIKGWRRLFHQRSWPRVVRIWIGTPMDVPADTISWLGSP